MVTKGQFGWRKACELVKLPALVAAIALLSGCAVDYQARWQVNPASAAHDLCRFAARWEVIEMGGSNPTDHHVGVQKRGTGYFVYGGITAQAGSNEGREYRFQCRAEDAEVIYLKVREEPDEAPVPATLRTRSI